MQIIYYPAQDDVTTARGEGEPLLLLVSFDEETAIVAPMMKLSNIIFCWNAPGEPD